MTLAPHVTERNVLQHVQCTSCDFFTRNIIIVINRFLKVYEIVIV